MTPTPDTPPNCEDCPNNIESVVLKGYRKCKITDLLLDKHGAIDHISKVGCLSHPSAREWLMRDVVEELEQFAESERGI